MPQFARVSAIEFLSNRKMSALDFSRRLKDELSRKARLAANPSSRPKINHTPCPTTSALEFSRNPQISAIAFIERVRNTPYPEIYLETNESIPLLPDQQEATKAA